MKANPYVYPSEDFKYLLKKGRDTVVKNGGPKSLDYFIDLLSPYFIFEVKTDREKSLEEQALDIFLDDRICYGGKENVLSEKLKWLKKFKTSIKKKKINLTILGFPFKIPVQLKTNRKLPDAGELASMLGLLNIAKNVERVTKTKTTISIFAEEGFAPFINLPKTYAQKYFQYLRKIANHKFFRERIRVIAISEMEKDKKFQKLFTKNTNNNLALYQRKEKEYMAKYKKTEPIVFRILNTLGYNAGLCEEVYSNKSDRLISNGARLIRKSILERLPESIAKYFAYLKTRDDLKFLESKIKNPLTMSVSPKPGRLGVFPISKAATKLPYHGVPLFDEGKGEFHIEYLIDLEREGGKLVGYNWNQDPDVSYFLYRK